MRGCITASFNLLFVYAIVKIRLTYTPVGYNMYIYPLGVYYSTLKTVGKIVCNKKDEYTEKEQK